MNHLFFVLIFAYSCFAADTNTTWSFVIMGDTRDKTTDTKTGISPDLAVLAKAIAKEKPELVIHSGDLINGYYTTKESPVHDKFIEQFQNWKDAVKPIYDYRNNKGIPIYPIRGNHEDGKYVTNKKLKQAYIDEFAKLMPQNGPEDEKGLTYVFSYKNARFFALDAYQDKKYKVIRGYINQQWLDKQLGQDKKMFTFAYSHTPAYSVGSMHASPFPDLYSHKESRDAIWASFKKGGTQAYFCGHIHLYTRGTVDGIEQIVVGDGGADTVAFDPQKVDPAVKTHYPAAAMQASDIETGFVKVTVDEKAGTATGEQKLWDPKTQKWKTGDSFMLKSSSGNL
jgi:hypothetical protein